MKHPALRRAKRKPSDSLETRRWRWSVPPTHHYTQSRPIVIKQHIYYNRDPAPHPLTFFYNRVIIETHPNNGGCMLNVFTLIGILTVGGVCGYLFSLIVEKIPDLTP
jgi:hypothetical protein